MDKFKKKHKKTSKKNIAILIITIFFAVAGIACIFIGAFETIVSWLLSFGIALVVLSLPVLVMTIRKILIKKVERM